MFRWWNGCKDSWRAQSGRPRRTKPRGWCSSERWGAGPSDNLWSEKGLDEARRSRARAGGEEDPTATVPRSAHESEAAFRDSLDLGHNKAKSVSSPVKSMRVLPQESQLHQSGYYLCEGFFLPPPCKTKCSQMLHARMPGRNASVSAEKCHERSKTVPLKLRKPER